MFVGAFIIIVILTWILVAMNVLSVVAQFTKDRNATRLYSFLTTLLVLGSLIIGVASSVIQRVIDCENLVLSDTPQTVHYYRR